MLFITRVAGQTLRLEKSHIFDPVTLLQCCNNGSVQKGKIMFVFCARLGRISSETEVAT